MKLLRLLLFALSLSTSLQLIAQQLSWSEVAPGVWKGVVGKPEAYDLLTASGAKPNTMALQKLGSAAFPLTRNDIAGVVRDGKTSLRFPLDREEQLYGFGLNFQTVHQRGKILQLHVDHY